jgi:Leucine-rich repeat (LRR) protein
MTLLHVLFDGNQFTGSIPESLGLVQNLTVLRLDRNRLSGDIPSSLNNLTNLQELHLSDNKFTGSLPNLTSLTSLYTLDVSNNPLALSPVPSWIPFLNSLSTLYEHSSLFLDIYRFVSIHNEKKWSSTWQKVGRYPT